MVRVQVFRDGRLDPETVGVEELGERSCDGLVWVDAAVPDDVAALDRIGQVLGLHPVTVEDLHHRGQRPKVEVFPGYAFVAARSLEVGRGLEPIEHELHAVVAPGFLVTVRDHGDPTLTRAQQRWARHPDLLDRHGGAFALYAVLDEVVDGYLVVIDHLEDRADELEDEVFALGASEDGAQLQERIFHLKRAVVRMRRALTPLRTSLDRLVEDPELVHPELLPYFRDVSDHVLRAAELADNIRELLTALLDVRVAQVANRTNDIMKQLTAWGGIILVPTLIAGIYGMNFDRMPELRWPLGYPFALGLMAVVAGGLYVAFRRRGWL